MDENERALNLSTKELRLNTTANVTNKGVEIGEVFEYYLDGKKYKVVSRRLEDRQGFRLPTKTEPKRVKLSKEEKYYSQVRKRLELYGNTICTEHVNYVKEKLGPGYKFTKSNFGKYYIIEVIR